MSPSTLVAESGLRNRVGVRLANLALRITSRSYRRFVTAAIWYGLETARRDAEADKAPPLPAGVRDLLCQAAREARLNSFNGHNVFEDALADWWLTEAGVPIPGDGAVTSSIPAPLDAGQAPSVRAALAYIAGDA